MPRHMQVAPMDSPSEFAKIADRDTLLSSRGDMDRLIGMFPE